MQKTCPVHAFTDGQCCDDARDCASHAVRLETLAKDTRRNQARRARAPFGMAATTALACAAAALAVSMATNPRVAERSPQKQASPQLEAHLKH